MIKKNYQEKLMNEDYVSKLVKDKLSIKEKVTTEKLTGGFSDAQIFTATTDSKKYVIRFLTDKSLKEKELEISALQIASQHNYGPHIYYADADKTVVIMEFLERKNISPEQRESESFYKSLAKILQKIHKGPNFENLKNRNIFYQIGAVIKKLKQQKSQGIPIEKLENVISIIHETLKPHLTLAPCHNDLNSDNLIFLGDHFKAIDFEDASQTDPFYDIATVVNSYCHTPEYEQILLSTYLGQQPTEKEWAKLYLMKQVSWLAAPLWFLKINPKQLNQYEKLHVPSQIEFFKELTTGKINLENPEHQLKYSKVYINYVISNVESQEFAQAIKVLNNSTKK